MLGPRLKSAGRDRVSQDFTEFYSGSDQAAGS
jgi:hypothetical protein